MLNSIKQTFMPQVLRIVQSRCSGYLQRVGIDCRIPDRLCISHCLYSCQECIEAGAESHFQDTQRLFREYSLYVFKPCCYEYMPRLADGAIPGMKCKIQVRNSNGV